MNKPINRRKFMKLAGVGATTTAFVPLLAPKPKERWVMVRYFKPVKAGLAVLDHKMAKLTEINDGYQVILPKDFILGDNLRLSIYTGKEQPDGTIRFED